jgi:general secretion pathway protein E
MPQNNSSIEKLNANPQLNELREKKIVAFNEDSGKLSIASSYRADAGVASLLAYCKRHEIPIELEWVTIEAINEINTTNIHPDLTNSNTSQARQTFNEITIEAVKSNASDIHIIVKKHGVLIKHRVQGDLIVMSTFSLTRADGELLLSAIYTTLTDISGRMYIATDQQDARVPNTNLPASIRNKVSGLRVATTPTEDGSMMVLRILYEDIDAQELSDLGYPEKQEVTIKNMNRHNTGFSMVVGPTGSGKSTTLKIIMSMLNDNYDGKRNMMALEDPSEFNMPGVNQVPITNVKSEEERYNAFNNMLRGFMRLDPDDIMVGEVRDQTTASLIVNAAMTGHRVWTTLHANNNIIAIQRMLLLGVSEHLLANPEVFRGVISQRLVKKLCPACRIPYDEVSQHPALARYLKLSGMDERLEPILKAHSGTIYFKNGCAHCNNTGRIGRTIVAEIFENTPDNPTMALMMKNEWSQARHSWLQSGGSTMMMHAVEKMMQGLIDPRAIEDVLDPIYLEVI